MGGELVLWEGEGGRMQVRCRLLDRPLAGSGLVILSEVTRHCVRLVVSRTIKATNS